MHLKGGLHCHSTCSDGKLTIGEVVEIYESLGFDFIALTDHDHLLRQECYQVVDQLRTDMIIFTGIELTMFEKGYVHINRIPGDHETLHVFNHPSELELPVEKVLERIKAIAERLPLDVVEITTLGFRTPEYDIPEIPYPKLASDDSHTRFGCGRAWIELDCRRDKDSIIRAVRLGEFWNCYAERA